MKYLLAGALAAIAFQQAANAADPVSYQVTIAGRDAGTMTRTDLRTGAREIVYRYVDRGRGPDVRSEIRLDSDKQPAELTVTGVDYFKVPVQERFSRSGASASWESVSDAGSTAQKGFYYPSQSTPEDLASLARALLAARGHTLPLIPGGQARLTESRTHPLPDGKQARLFLIEGLEFQPTPIWLDEQGELIAEGGTWTQTVRTDLKSSGPEFVRLQEEVTVAREKAQAASLSRTPKGPVLFRNANVFDAKGRKMLPATDVLVEGNRIAAIGKALKAPAGAETIDATGKTLLPGLWDMHVHVSTNVDGLLHLGSGVTSVRDMAMDMDELLERRRRFDSGELPGPRILMAGFMDGPGPLAAPTKALVSTPEQVREWIARYAAAGYVQIKLYSSLDPKLVPVAIKAAHDAGMRISGHVPATMTMEDVVRAGFDEVQHANFWFLNFMDAETLAKTNGMTRFYAVAAGAKDQSLQAAGVERMVALLKEHRTVLDPTMIAFEGMFLSEPRALPRELAVVGGRLPPIVRRGEMVGGLAKDAPTRAGYAQSYERMKEMLNLLHRSGITIVPGTDAMAGFTYPRELEIYTEAGIPALDVLAMATIGSARVMKRETELGAIEPGMLADLVLVDGDPANRMGDIRNTVLVVKDGRLFDPAKLHAALGVAPATR